MTKRLLIALLGALVAAGAGWAAAESPRVPAAGGREPMPSAVDRAPPRDTAIRTEPAADAGLGRAIAVYLREHPQIDASRVRVTIEPDTVTLAGTVRTGAEKAQVLLGVRRIVFDRGIVDRLQVAQPEPVPPPPPRGLAPR